LDVQFSEGQQTYSPIHYLISILHKKHTWHQSSDDEPLPDNTPLKLQGLLISKDFFIPGYVKSLSFYSAGGAHAHDISIVPGERLVLISIAHIDSRICHSTNENLPGT
jgi:hypothetical protein